MQDHQKQVQFLMQQLAEGEAASSGPIEQLEETKKVQVLEAKVNLLEKDLYYYKKTSRDLRKKVKELSGEKRADGSIQTSAEGGVAPARAPSGVQDAAESVPPTFETRKPSTEASGGAIIKDVHTPHGKTDWVSDGKAATHAIVKKPKKQLRQLR